MSDAKILSNNIKLEEDITRLANNFQSTASPQIDAAHCDNKFNNSLVVNNSDNDDRIPSNNDQSKPLSRTAGPQDALPIKKEEQHQYQSSQQTTTTSETITLRNGISLRIRKPPQISDDQSSTQYEHKQVNTLTVESSNSNGIDANQDENSLSTMDETSQDKGILCNKSDYPEPVPPKPHGPEDKCDVNPEFAIICSFISQFGEKLGLELDIERLKFTLEDCSSLHDELIETHVKLLRKRRKYFLKDQWEKALIKFALEYSYEDALEIESVGYKDTRPSVKMQLLRRLMEAQFDCDSKFKLDVNNVNADELRPMPMGRDNKGHIYWNRSDSKGNFLVFREWSMDYKSWTAVCNDKERLDELIDQLEKSSSESLAGEPMSEPINQLPEIFPELFIREETLPEESPPKKGKAKGKGRGNKKGRSLLVESQQDPSSLNTERNLTNHSIIKSETLTDNRPYELNRVNQINGFIDIDTATNGHVPSQNNQDHIESQVAILLNSIINSLSELPQDNTSTLNSDSARNDTQTKVATGRTRKYTKKVKTEELPRRTSSRIQQIQLKKIAEEEEELRKKIANRDAIDINKKTDDITCADQESIDGENSQCTNSNRTLKDKHKVDSSERAIRDRKRKKKTNGRRGRGKKKISWDKDDSDLSESSSTSSGMDDIDEQEEETLKFDDIDDEFACEEEDANAEPVILKKARTAGKAHDEDESIVKVEEDKPCGRCSKSNEPEWILLCDRCDDGYHTTCCIPPLMFIPDGDWFCPPCEHKMLLEKLYELRTIVIGVIEAREREKKKMRLRAPPKVLPVTEPTAELGVRKTRNIIDELAEPLALQLLDEEEDYDAAPRRSKKQYNSKKREKPAKKTNDQFEVRKPSRTYSRRPFESKRVMQRDNLSGTESSSNAESNISNDSDEELPMARRAKRQVSYRFKEYDDLINSAIKGDSFVDQYGGEDEDLDEEINEEEEEDELTEGFKSRGKDMATIEALANQADDPFPPLQIIHHDEDKLREDGGTKIEPCEGELAAVMPSDPMSTKPSGEKKNGKRKKKARRLNDLNSPSCTEVETSDESFIASAASEIEEEEEEDSNGDGSYTSIDEIVCVSRKKTKYSGKKGRSSGRKSKQNRHSDYVYQDSDSDYEPCKKRRASSKRVSYKESTDEEFSDEYSKSSRKKKKRVVDSSASDESNQAWKSSVKNKKFIVDDDEEYDEDDDDDDDEEDEEPEYDDQEEKDQEEDLEEDPDEEEEDHKMDHEEDRVLNYCETSNSPPNQQGSQVNQDIRQPEILENKEKI